MRAVCAVLRGLLGALLGAALFHGLWFCLLLFLMVQLGSPVAFVSVGGAVLAGRAACEGWRLFRGWRGGGRRGWQGVLAAAVLCALLPLLFLIMFSLIWLVRNLPLMLNFILPGAPARLAPDPLTLLRDPELWLCSLFCCILPGLLTLGGVLWGRKRLMAYAAPLWRQDPRRVARLRAPFLGSNLWPRQAPPPQDLPDSFSVGAGPGTVRVYLDFLEAEEPGEECLVFSLEETAGVLVGPARGSCVLYSRRGRTLARFTAEQDNAALFVQYLEERGVPFRGAGRLSDPLFAEDGEPSSPEPEARP